MLSYKAINRAADKGMIFNIITFVLALMGSTPEASKHMTDGIKEATGTIVFFEISPVIDIPPTQQVPIVLEWIAVIWFIWFALTGIKAKFKSLSPQVFGHGLLHSLPYCGRASVKTDGKIMSVRAGGSAAPIMPVEGNTIISAPATHVHKSGEHLFVMAELFPDLPASAIPIESKMRTLPQRNGFNGIDTCATGWLSPDELENNPSIIKKEHDAKGKPIDAEYDTQTTILAMNQSNESVDRLFEMMRYNVNTLKLDLSLINRLKTGELTQKAPSLANKFFKNGG